MPNPKAVLIANPKTGRHSSRRNSSIQTIREHLTSQGLDTELVFTSGPGDATRIAARAASDGVSDVIVSGGDGTINEALQGLVGTDTRLAILPCGTANVLARELKVPLNPGRAAEVIAKRKLRRIHVGLAIDEGQNIHRYFLLMAGIGLDAEVVRRVNPQLKRHLGKGAFWLTGLSQLADWHPVEFTIEINGQTYRSTFASVGNAPSYGGELAITPGASLDHPEFEICIVQTTSRLRYLRLLSYAMRSSGLQPVEKGVCIVRSTQARAFGNDVAVQVDGEVIGVLPMRFEIAPESIEVVVP
ncbi:MAG TPA: diacylglycerol kinase family protein [Pyrinomonadaceae bacterium]|nr:diacylglycerol kinase family protein [Pyrinomonadaceae bacterium]